MPKAVKAEPAAEEAWDPAAEEEEPPVLGAEVAYAKSGRSLCKECREPISNGALRIGGAPRVRTLRRARALTCTLRQLISLWETITPLLARC
jgi:hypothetical protein